MVCGLVMQEKGTSLGTVWEREGFSHSVHIQSCGSKLDVGGYFTPTLLMPLQNLRKGRQRIFNLLMGNSGH